MNAQILRLMFYLLFVIIPGTIWGQLDFFFGPGYGVSYTISNYNRIQYSYESYLKSVSDNNPGMQFRADPTFDNTALHDLLSFQAGISFDGGYFGFAFLPNTNRQSRSVLFQNGYGRKFDFSDRRYEFLFDLGYGSKYIDFFGSFGVNMNKYRMVSYTLYPDGSQSLTNEFFYNGVYKNFDAGLSYGIGIKIKPIPFLALELRYFFAHDNFPGEKTDIVADNSGLSDFSYAKTIGTDAFPEDFTLGFSGVNKLTPDFRQHYLTASLVFHFNTYKK